jgi:hypothetical protein
MLGRHKFAAAVGAVGVALVLAHVVLGPAVMPVRGAVGGLILVAAAGLYLVIARRVESSPIDHQTTSSRRCA